MERRKIIVSILLFLNFSIVFGQVDLEKLYDAPDDITRLINNGLITLIKDRQESIKDGSVAIKDIREYLIFTDLISSYYELPEELKLLGIKTAKFRNLLNEPLEGRVSGFYVECPKLINNKFIVSILYMGISKNEQGKVESGIGGQYGFIYEYSCKKKDWILIDSWPRPR